MKKTIANLTLLSLPLIFVVAQAWVIFDLPVQLPIPGEGVSDEGAWIMARNQVWSNSDVSGGEGRQAMDSAEKFVRSGKHSDGQTMIAPTKLTLLLLSIGIIGLAGFSDRSSQPKQGL